MNTLIALLIAVIVLVVIFWLIDMIGLPGNFHWIAKAIVALIGIIYLLQFLGIVV